MTIDEILGAIVLTVGGVVLIQVVANAILMFAMWLINRRPL